MPVLPNGRDVDDLKINELRKELERRGLSRSGSKKDLSARLSGNILASEHDGKSKKSKIDKQLELVNHGHKEDGDAVELDTIESDDDAADTSTGTVIFVPKEKPDTLASASEEQAVSGGHLVTKVSTSAEKPETPTSDVKCSSSTPRTGDKNHGPLSLRSTSSSGSKSSVGESHSRRRKLWGACGGASSSHVSSTAEGSLISFSTDTLEQIVPTLSVPDNKSSKVIQPNASAGDPAMTADSAAEKLRSPSQQSLGYKDGSPNMLVTEAASVAPQCINTLSVTDEEVEVMDATVEGGLDTVEVGGTVSQKQLLRTKHTAHEQVDARQQDTRQVTRKRTNEMEFSAGNDSKPSPIKRKGLKETKAVGYLIDQPERVEPCQPTKTKPTEFVHIRCLVRPFTANQLRQMLTSAYGQVVDLWLDRIKSTSVVRLESEQVALSCREGLDGSRWPSINPRVLRCDFATEDLFIWMKQYGDEANMHPPKHLLSADKVVTNPSSDKEKTSDDHDCSDGKVEGHNRKTDDLRQKLNRRDGESVAGVRNKPTTPDTSGADVKDVRAEPAKMLDDLFRKTTTAPCIYWLPLTEEEAKARAAEQADLAAKRGSTRATRSPFAGASEADQLTSAAIDGTSDNHDERNPATATSASVSAKSRGDTAGSSRVSPSSKALVSGKQANGRDSNDRKERRRDGSPFMPAEKKSESSGKTAQKPTNAPRDTLLDNRRQRSFSSSPSPSKLSKRSRGQHDSIQRRRPIVGDYSRRRSSRSRSRSGGARYRSRLDTSTGGYRRRRGSSPHTHRSRR